MTPGTAADGSLDSWFVNDSSDRHGREGPEHYIADEPLLDAIRSAVFLGQPLLVTGEPGCGKTQLADHIAWRMGLSRPIGGDQSDEPEFEYALRFDTKSESRARDLFYSIDLVERFHAAHVEKERDKIDPLNFIRFHALGRALLYARPKDDLSGRLLDWQAHPGAARRSVVLIDEIDKVPSDVPNDLLMEIENLRFWIPELNRAISAPSAFRPIVVITSNSEKPLSDAFLRRCIYYDIPYPGRARLMEIVTTRTGVDKSAPLLGDAVDIFEQLRRLPLQKRPATAELLNFIQSLRASGLALSARLRSPSDWQRIAFATLLKSRDDQRLIEASPVAGATG